MGPWIFPVFRALRAMRRLRGTAADPFGRTRLRRMERALVAEYDGLVAEALELLGPETAADVLAIAELPDVVRGYEDVKVRSVERFRGQASGLLLQLGVTDLVSLAAGDREPAVARAT
jgi:indolepyruvate ferredoxin oxidoreductase